MATPRSTERLRRRPRSGRPRNAGGSIAGVEDAGLHGNERQVFECLPLGLVVFDPSLHVTYCNPAARELLTVADSLPDALQAVAVDSRYQDWPTVLRTVLDERREQRFEQIVLRSGDSGDRLVDLLCLPLTDTAGDVIGGILVVEDVTAQAGLEKRLAVSERMAAVGKLAARVAHDLNNPLDGILRYLNLAIRAVEVGQTDRLKDYLLSARGGLTRMTEIVRELERLPGVRAMSSLGKQGSAAAYCGRSCGTTDRRTTLSTRVRRRQTATGGCSPRSTATPSGTRAT
ncbi:MAG TPA: PAS domain-containing protein, partial [Phycisphaerae bacterium]|nr:PAS domain-containing protein [Phycisphaerae bacterium]